MSDTPAPVAQPLSAEEEATLRALPRHGSPYEINGAIARDAMIDRDVLRDAAFYDRRILIVTLRSALAAAPSGLADIAGHECGQCRRKKHADPEEAGR